MEGPSGALAKAVSQQPHVPGSRVRDSQSQASASVDSASYAIGARRCCEPPDLDVYDMSHTLGAVRTVRCRLDGSSVFRLTGPQDSGAVLLECTEGFRSNEECVRRALNGLKAR